MKGEAVMKNRVSPCIVGGLLLAYCVPYYFFGAYGDAVSGTVLYYALMLLAFALFAVLSRRAHCTFVAFAGPLLSLISSHACVSISGLEEMNWYFKPFSAYRIIILQASLVSLFQLVVLRLIKNRE